MARQPGAGEGERVKLFCFGLGFSATTLARRLLANGWQVAGTARGEAKCDELCRQGIEAIKFDGMAHSSDVSASLANATHVLAGVPPGEGGDPVLSYHAKDIASTGRLWLGYLSTVGVYGDVGGAWCDEEAALVPMTDRSSRRVATEGAWSAFARQNDLPLAIFRLAGIYGPGRNQIANLRNGTARRIIKPGQVFNRIHVDDVATVLEASIARPPHGVRAYNVCDNEPAPPQDVLVWAAELLRIPPPPETAFEDASMSPIAKSFYADNKRCFNRRIKDELGITLAYPSYREGLAALAAASEH